MSTASRYAVWYATIADYHRIQTLFMRDPETGVSPFEQAFDVTIPSDDEHVVVIWYGPQHPAPGAVSAEHELYLEHGWEQLTDPVHQALQRQQIGPISFLYALPDVVYESATTTMGDVHFLGNFTVSTHDSFAWLTSLINDENNA